MASKLSKAKVRGSSLYCPTCDTKLEKGATDIGEEFYFCNVAWCLNLSLWELDGSIIESVILTVEEYRKIVQ